MVIQEAYKEAKLLNVYSMIVEFSVNVQGLI